MACPHTIRTLGLIQRSLIRFLLAHHDQRRSKKSIPSDRRQHLSPKWGRPGIGALGVIFRKDWKFWDDQIAPGSSGSAMGLGLPGCKPGAKAIRAFAQFAAVFEQRKLPIASDCCQSR